jgi:type I restriction enzyme M protein
MIKLILIKLQDELTLTDKHVQFGITADEYRSVVAGRATGFEKRLEKLYQAVRHQFPDLLTDPSLRLGLATLAFLVSRIQHFSFLKTPGEVKGQAFQAFVYRHQRGDRGEYFTPLPIVTLATKILAPSPGERLIDPACGSGGFMIEAISYVSRHFPKMDRSTYIRNCLVGIEFNPDVALAAMLRLAFDGGKGSEIICANALLDTPNLENSFDVVLTNPPFGSKGKVEDARILKLYALARKWRENGGGQWEVTPQILSGQTPEVLFIEKCLCLLKPGGRMGIVLPDGLLQNVSNSHIRFWINTRAKIIAVVSIPHEAFIPYGTGIKTSLVVLQKKPSRTGKVFMARIEKIGYDVKGNPVYERDSLGNPICTRSGKLTVAQDVDRIADAYERFRKEGVIEHISNVYLINEEAMNSRLDVEHYEPSDQDMIFHLRACNARPLGGLVDILCESDDFRLADSGEIRYIAISDVDYQTMQIVTHQTIKPGEAPSRATYRIRTGDIITAIAGASTGTPRQASAFVSADEDGAICSNGFAVLRNIREVNPLYLLAYMRTDKFLRQVRRLMTGHAIPCISIEDLSKVLVPIPSPETQKSIADRMLKMIDQRKKTLCVIEEIVREAEML